MIEFIIKLESMLICDNYNKDVLANIIEVIRNYFEADCCIWNRTGNIDDLIISGDCADIDFNIGFHISNPRVFVDCSLKKYIDVYLANLNKIINERELLNSKLYIDSLTGIYDNNALIKKISSKDSFSNVGVIFVDANGLGVINNTYGHEEGDNLLKTIALCLSKCFRKDDVYRKGGDEFVVVACEIDKDLFYKKISLFRELLSNTNYSASIGFCYSDSTNNINDIIKEADNLMYVEKEEYRRNNIDKYFVKKLVK